MVSQTVAEFVASADPESLPPEVSHAVKRSLLNFFATALEGTHDIAVETALKTMLPFAGMSEATLIGRAERADAMTAAFINAAAANVHDFDDTHIRTVIHPTAPAGAVGWMTVRICVSSKSCTLAAAALMKAAVIASALSARPISVASLIPAKGSIVLSAVSTAISCVPSKAVAKKFNNDRLTAWLTSGGRLSGSAEATNSATV